MSEHSRGVLACQFEAIRWTFAQAEGLPFGDLLRDELLAEVGGPETWNADDEPVSSPLVTLGMFLSQVLDPDPSCRQAVARLAADLASRNEPACGVGTGGYCKARRRLSEDALHGLMRQSGRALPKRANADWLWLGRPVRVADGSTLTLLDTPANQAEYPQPDGQKPGLGFPMVRLVILFCLATGAVLDASCGAYSGKGTGELSLLREIWGLLVAGDVLLGDRLYCSYFELALLQQRRVETVTRRHQSRKTDFRRGQRLGAKDHLVVWTKPARPDWLDEATYAALPATLTVRETEVTEHHRGFRSNRVIVISTFLDAEQVTRADLTDLFAQRWQVETNIRTLKQALGMHELRCKTPPMIRQELWVNLLAYNLICGLIATAATQHHLRPRDISFTGAVQTLLAFHGCLQTQREHREELLERVLMAIAAHRIGNRPNRVEPRAIKRRPSKYPRLMKPRSIARTHAMRTKS